MSRIVESLYNKYSLNESDNSEEYGLVPGTAYEIDYNDDGNPAKFEYVGYELDDGIDTYKFKPLNDVAHAVAEEEAEAGGFEYDGFLYMDDEGVYYTFIDGEEDEEDW